MKRHLNTLFVTTEGAYLAAEGETVVIRIEGKDKMHVPLHLLESVACFGRVSVSPILMGRCGDKGVSISFFSEYGRFLARVVGPTSGNVLLRREQFRRADDLPFSLSISKAMVTAKALNSRTVLQRFLRDHAGRTGADVVAGAVRTLATAIRSIPNVDTLNELRGVEGNVAATYFGVFEHLVLNQNDTFRFERRSRRPPLDPVNALMSFCYVLLAHDVRSAIEGVGLDPQVGFIHSDRPGRAGLAMDLMEELRAFLADRLVISLVNRQQVAAKGFEYTEGGGVLMNDATRKTLLQAYQARKQETIEHPFLREKMTVGRLAHIQALLLARYLRGDLDAYPPFVWR